jgi:hypothetical protein
LTYAHKLKYGTGRKRTNAIKKQKSGRRSKTEREKE